MGKVWLLSLCEHRGNTAVKMRVHPDICPFPTDGRTENTVLYCQSGSCAYPNYTALQKSLFCLINMLCLAGTVCSLVVFQISKFILVDSAFALVLVLH